MGNSASLSNATTASSSESVINNWEVITDFDFDFVQHPKIYSSISENENPNSYPTRFTKKLDDSTELFTSYELVEHYSNPHKSDESLPSQIDINFKPALTSCPTQPNCSKLSNFNGVSDSNNTVTTSKLVHPQYCLSGAEDMIVLYHTSLRGIRTTYEDCCKVRMILKGYGVLVDERDVQMDPKYRRELQNVFGGKGFTLPKLFIGGKYVGDANEIQLLHDEGELGLLLGGFPVKDPAFVCVSCGDARFVPCSSCNGSKKVFEKDGWKTRRCFWCNENGLIRCPDC